MKRLFFDDRGSAGTETVAAATLMLLIGMWAVDELSTWGPAQRRVVDLRTATWSVLRDDAPVAGIQSEIAADSAPEHAIAIRRWQDSTSLDEWAPGLGVAVAPAHGAWTLERVGLEASWPRYFDRFGRPEVRLGSTIVRDPGFGPLSTPDLELLLSGANLLGGAP